MGDTHVWRSEFNLVGFIFSIRIYMGPRLQLSSSNLHDLGQVPLPNKPYHWPYS